MWGSWPYPQLRQLKGGIFLKRDENEGIKSTTCTNESQTKDISFNYEISWAKEIQSKPIDYFMMIIQFKVNNKKKYMFVKVL